VHNYSVLAVRKALNYGSFSLWHIIGNMYNNSNNLFQFLAMQTKKTKTTETFIKPEQFEEYSRRGFVVFMERPTAFGTYKAIKIELITR